MKLFTWPTVYFLKTENALNISAVDKPDFFFHVENIKIFNCDILFKLLGKTVICQYYLMENMWLSWKNPPAFTELVREIWQGMIDWPWHWEGERTMWPGHRTGLKLRKNRPGFRGTWDEESLNHKELNSALYFGITWNILWVGQTEEIVGKCILKSVFFPHKIIFGSQYSVSVTCFLLLQNFSKVHYSHSKPLQFWLLSPLLHKTIFAKVTKGLHTATGKGQFLVLILLGLPAVLTRADDASLNGVLSSRIPASRNVLFLYCLSF